MTVQQVATILGVFGGLVGFGVGLWQYARAQAWKRAEFVAKEIREFESLHPVRVVLRMLDWNERDFELHPDAEDPDERRVVLNDRDIARALAPHADRPDGFGPDEAAVRDYFSVFFDRLERFDHYRKSGLVRAKDLEPYLRYWLEILADPASERKPPEFREAVAEFIETYEYRGVRDLLAAFGLPLSAVKRERVRP